MNTNPAVLVRQSGRPPQHERTAPYVVTAGSKTLSLRCRQCSSGPKPAGNVSILQVQNTEQQAEARLAAHSTGARHRQLVKAGNDDLRQDAVMQQFFALINAVLAESAAARARRLRIATYKVRFCELCAVACSV